MSEYPIPGDLQNDYAELKQEAHELACDERDSSYTRWIIRLIERIAKQEAEIERLSAENASLMKVFSDSSVVHINILRGTIALTKAQAIHIAGLPANVEEQLASLKAQVERLSAWQTSVLRRRGLSDAPCDVCGYNGVGYYQPSTHPCAARAAKGNV